MKKVNVLFAVGAIMLACQSQAGPGLLDSYEGSPLRWVNPSWSTGDCTLTTSTTTGVTHGAHSLQVTMPFISGAGDQFRWLVTNDVGMPLANMEHLYNAMTVYAEMTIPADEGIWPTTTPPIWWFNGKFIFNDGSGLWREAPTINYPRSPGTYTIAWDISQVSNEVNLSQSFHRIGIAVNHTPDVARTFYLDNFRTDTNVQGTCNLPSYVGDPSTIMATVEVYSPGGSTPLESTVVPLGAYGEYTCPTGQFAGTYDVAIKASHWLNVRLNNVTFDVWGVYGLSSNGANGDVNGDNGVDIGDYSLLSAAYGSFIGDPNYTVNSDLNGDDSVDIGDYSILSANYGSFGD